MITLPLNWTIVTCPRCGDPAFAELGVIRLHAGADSRERCAGSGWMVGRTWIAKFALVEQDEIAQLVDAVRELP
jgi:hypothetical protein